MLINGQWPQKLTWEEGHSTHTVKLAVAMEEGGESYMPWEEEIGMDSTDLRNGLRKK